MGDEETGSQVKKQENSPEELNEMEVSNLSDRVQSNDYKDAQQHKKNIETIKKDHLGIKNAIFETKNILEGINRKLHHAEDHTSDLEDKVGKNPQKEQQKQKRILKNEDSLRDL